MLDGYCGWIEAGQGDKMVAVLTHVDVVPVEAEGWKADPFDATLIDGKVYGRGICDDKRSYHFKSLCLKGINRRRRFKRQAGALDCRRRRGKRRLGMYEKIPPDRRTSCMFFLT